MTSIGGFTSLMLYLEGAITGAHIPRDSIGIFMDEAQEDYDALLVVVEATQGLKQVWLDKGHGGQAEVEAHRKIDRALAALPKHLREAT